MARPTASAPERRCVGCGRHAPKAELQRLVVAGDVVVTDPSGTLPGRGAYVCDAACAQRAIARRAFPRAFRRPIPPAPDLVESLT